MKRKRVRPADVEAFEERVGVRAGGRRAYMPTLLCYDACMSRQMTIRGVSEEVGQRLESLSRSRGKSVNATVLAILESAVGVDERRQRLARYATWTQEELEEFNEALSAQRWPATTEGFSRSCGGLALRSQSTTSGLPRPL